MKLLTFFTISAIHTCLHFDRIALFEGKLKRLNAIFERGANRRLGGIREDKLLRILPSGTAPKYGIDPAAIRGRLLARREWQEESRRTAAAAAKAARRVRRRRRTKIRGAEDNNKQVATSSGVVSSGMHAATRPCPELRVISRVR